MEIALDQVEWRDRSGRRVSLSVNAAGAITAMPWMPRLNDLRTRGWRQGIKDVVVWATGKSQYLISKFLNQLFTATAYSFPATLYMALWTSALTAASTGATSGECSYTGYARVAMTANGTNFSTSAAGSATTNNVAITFGANASGGSQTVTYFAILDSATLGAGNILYWGSVSSAIIGVGSTPQVNTSALTATEV